MDRIWALWQDYRGHDEIRNPANFGWEHFSSDLDRPLRFIQGRRIDFDHPSRRRTPTPREVLNIDGIVDVRYVNDSLARMLVETSRSFRNGGNNPNWNTPARGRVVERCRSGSRPEAEEQEEEPVEEEPEVTEEPEVVEEEPICVANESACGSEVDCCSGFCSSMTGVCERECYGRGSRCGRNEDCCSNMCNRFGRCENVFMEVQTMEAVCLAQGSTCDDGAECCSSTCNRQTGRCTDNCLGLGDVCETASDCCNGYCSSRLGRCARVCYGAGSRCDGNEDCCSGMCNESGRCSRGSVRRSLAETDVIIKDEQIEFSEPHLKSRWYELVADYPDDPARLWDILAREDCSRRASAVHHELHSASKEWISKMFKGNNTRVFNCHYVKDQF